MVSIHRKSCDKRYVNKKWYYIYCILSFCRISTIAVILSTKEAFPYIRFFLSQNRHFIPLSSPLSSTKGRSMLFVSILYTVTTTTARKSIPMSLLEIDRPRDDEFVSSVQGGSTILHGNCMASIRRCLMLRRSRVDDSEKARDRFTHRSTTSAVI